MSLWWDENNETMVVLMALPDDVAEAVTRNEDGSHTIIINERQTDGQRLRAYRHALHHIHAEDFDREDVQVIELEAGGVA